MSYGKYDDQIASEQGPSNLLLLLGCPAFFQIHRISNLLENVLQAHVSIKDVPNSRWNADDFFDPEGVKVKLRKTNIFKIGAFVEGFEFNSEGETTTRDVATNRRCQLWAVETSAEALPCWIWRRR